jgi:lipoate-protein ligase A
MGTRPFRAREELQTWLPSFARCLIELNDRQAAQAAVARDDALAEKVGRGEAPSLARIWTNRRSVVVPKWRLRGAAAGSIVDEGGREWPICTRRSGGAAVAHGPGILNVTFILRRTRDSRPAIDEAYRLWIEVVDSALVDAYGVAVEAATVEGAFCHGRYDAVVDGRKLAGTAQARRCGSVVVHGTVLIDVERRAYLGVVQAAEQQLGMEKHGVYDAERIVSLRELVGRPVPTAEVAAVIAAAVGLVR